MSKTLESLLSELPQSTTREPRTCEVDLTDLLGDGWVMQYREPSVADLFAAGDTRTLAEWERVMPDMPRDLATTLELIARLHISPPAAELPTGKFYTELLRRLPPQTAIAVLRRIGDAIANEFSLADIESQAEAKKKPSVRAVKR
jgi:hypothetical protein